MKKAIKGIELNPHQLEAYKNGATILMFPVCEKYLRYQVKELSKPVEPYIEYEGTILEKSPLQKGDEFFIREDFYSLGCWDFSQLCDSDDHDTTQENCIREIAYKDTLHTWDLAHSEDEYDIDEASEMREDQARYKGEVLGVEIKRVQDIDFWHGIASIIGGGTSRIAVIQFSEWLSEQGINYEDNPYFFLYKIKAKK